MQVQNLKLYTSVFLFTYLTTVHAGQPQEPGKQPKPAIPYADSSVFGLALEKEGSVVVVGAFKAINGAAKNRVARLTKSLVLDTRFNLGDGPDDTVQAVAIQNDGKVLIAGRFNQVHGKRRRHIARLLPDGGLDSTFDPGDAVKDIPFELTLQPDGKVLVGAAHATRLIRLMPNGSSDATFGAKAVSSFVTAVRLLTDGKMVVGTYDGVVRLNGDGSTDESFSPAVSGHVNDLLAMEDGSVLLAGRLQKKQTADTYKFVRLLPDGKVDPKSAHDFDEAPATLHSAPDGKVLVGGVFTSFDSKECRGIVRMLQDFKHDNALNVGKGPNGPVEAFTILSDNRILVAGEFENFNNKFQPYLAVIPLGSASTK